MAQGWAYFDSLRHQSPDNPYVYYAIGMLEKGRKNFEQAVGNLKVCIKLDPKYAPAYLQLANVYIEEKDLETPANYFRTLLQEDSLNAAAHYGLGCVYQFKKEWTKGAEAFGKSLSFYQGLIHAYYLKGEMYSNLRNHQQALETWVQGQEVASKSNDLELQSLMAGNAGRAYNNLGQWQKAVPLVEEALNLARAIGSKDQEARHLNVLGSSYASLAQFDKALDSFGKAKTIALEIRDEIFLERLLSNMSVICMNKGEYKTGVEYATQALKMAETRGDSEAVARGCLNLGANYAGQANFPAALQYYERALAINKEQDNKQEVGRLLMNMGNIYKSTGEVSRAIDAYTQSLAMVQQISNKVMEAHALGSLGFAYSGLSDYTTANNYFQQALVLAEQNGDVNARGTYLGNIGVVYKKWGNFAKALAKMQEALALHKKIGNRGGTILHYTNIANIYERQGNYLHALDYHKQALAVSQAINAKHQTSRVLGNIGVVYVELGELNEALIYFQRALQLKRETGFKEGEAAILADIGKIHQNRSEYGAAEDSFEVSLKVARTIKEEEDESTALIALGDLQVERKNYPQALNYYQQSLALIKRMGQKEQEGGLHLAMGKVHLEKSDLATALSFFQKSLNLGMKMDAFDLMQESLAGLAAVAEKQKRYDDALKYYGQAIDKIESVRERLKIEAYKTKFIAGKLEIYEAVITLLIRMGRFEDAYNYLQRFRARSFLEILSPQHIDFAEGVTPGRLQRYRDWEQKLREIYGLLGNEYGKEETQRNVKLIAALNDSLQRIQSQHQKISDEILLHHPRYAQLTGIAQPLGLREIQQKILRPKLTLVEYFVGPEITAVYVIQPDTFHCELLTIKRETLEEQVRQLRQPFTDVKAGKIKNLADVDFNVKLAQQLYERLFKPIEKHLAQNTQLLIVPDGVLHYLPFEALVTGVEKTRHDPQVTFARFENCRYLVEKYAITYLPAASVAAVEKNNEQRVVDRLLAFGSPDFGRFTDSSATAIFVKASQGLLFAPLSDRDVREVALIMQPADTFFKKEATEDRFKREAGKAASIYLSTHAIADESQPMYSLIAFAQNDDPKEDGFLHTYEVFNLRLNADLVTLSACETGLGELSRGEGLIGLTRAFIYAGAPSVLVSLWSVDESTAALMKIFYQNLKDGMTKAEALRQAKLKLLRTRENGVSFAHPFLWAPFVLVGEAK